MSQPPLNADSKQLDPRVTGTSANLISAEHVTRLKNELSKLQRQAALQIIELEQIKHELVKENAERKRLAEELRKREAQLNEAQELASLGSWEYEPDTGAVWWSEQMCRMFGIDPHATRMTYELFLSLIHSEDREAVQGGVAEVAAGKSHRFSRDYRVPVFGTEKIFSSRGILLQNLDEQRARMVGTAQDVTERVRVERQLRQAEERYRKLVESSPDTMLISCEGKIAWINPAGLKLLGASDVTQILGEPVLRFVAPECREIVRERMRKMHEFREPAPGLEERYLRVDGAAVDVEVTAIPFEFLGRPATLVVIHEITERKRALQQIAFQGSLLNQVRNGVVATDAAGKIVFWNQYAETLYQWKASEVLGRSLIEVMVPEDKMEEAAVNRRSLESAGFWEGEFMVKRKDGSRLMAHMIDTVIRDNCGTIQGYVRVSVDLTQRKSDERALRENEERFRLVTQATKDGIWDFDITTGTLWWNDNFEPLFGARLKEEAPTVEWWANRIHPSDRERVMSSFGQVIAGASHEWVVEYRWLHPDGQMRYLSDRAYILRDDTGHATRMIGAIQDRTQEHEAREALRRLSGQMLEVQENERRRIARELHDSTAQKLTAILMHLGFLEDAVAEMPENVRKLVAECLTATENSTQEVRTLSYLLHPPLLDELGLEAALDAFIVGFSRRSGIDVRLEINGDLPDLSQEVGLALFRVVQEGLTNVLRHSGSRAAIVKLAKMGVRVVLEVCDQGCGINTDQLEQFSRKGSAGMGVGLMGMRERLSQLGGELEIDSFEQGTTLRAIVPQLNSTQ